MSILVAFNFLSAAWQRVKASRFAVLYISFIVVSSIIQLGLRAHVYTLDSRSSQTIETVLVSGRARKTDVPVLTSDGSLQLCPQLASTGSFGSCETVWDPKDEHVHILVRQQLPPLSDQTCLTALNYPYYVLHSDLREDVVSIGLQLFSLCLALVAIAQKHLSHFVTNALLQVISVLWAAIRVSDTGKSSSEFTSLITNGACGGEILGNFWSRRLGFDVAVMALEIIGLLLSVAFGWKAAQNLGLTNAQLPHLSASTNKLYKVMVASLTIIELSLFFSVTSGILWVDQLFFLDASGGLGFTTKALYILATTLMVPVLILGWIALYREMWKCVLIFLPCAFIYLAGWGLTFVLVQFRFTVVSWRLFGVVSILTFLLAFLTFVFALTTACYFGKGMKLISQGQDRPVSPATSTRSASSLEKGELSFSLDSSSEKLETTTLPNMPYQARVPKAKAVAISRGLTISPPPLH